MPHQIIELNGSVVESVRSTPDDGVVVRFAPARVVKSQGVAGVDASTRWLQDGELVIREAEHEGAVPVLPATTAGGSMESGGYKYLEMIPVPVPEGGYAELVLRFADAETPVVIRGERAQLRMEGTARYVEHIKETQPKG